MNDDYWDVKLTDGTTERLYASPRVYGDVLYMDSHFGVTGGLKEQVCFPLVNVLWWKKAER